MKLPCKQSPRKTTLAAWTTGRLTAQIGTHDPKVNIWRGWGTSMGDMADGFDAISEERKNRHQSAKEKNTEILNASTIHFDWVNSETAIIREPLKPKVDFYPSTGRWKVGAKMYSGGAKSFLKWYAKK